MPTSIEPSAFFKRLKGRKGPKGPNDNGNAETERQRDGEKTINLLSHVVVDAIKKLLFFSALPQLSASAFPTNILNALSLLTHLSIEILRFLLKY
jgi:hypothetical protein